MKIVRVLRQEHDFHGFCNPKINHFSIDFSLIFEVSSKWLSGQPKGAHLFIFYVKRLILMISRDPAKSRNDSFWTSFSAEG